MRRGSAAVRPLGLGVEAFHRVRRRVAGRPVILMYHRVGSLGFDPQLLAVRPAHFAEHLDVLRRSFRILPLAELAAAVADRRLPRRSVVITIDDGYADAATAASPLLASFDAPATVFVTTDHVGRRREFWWDELERLVLHPGRLPPVVRLRVAGEDVEWDLHDDAADYREHDRSWDVEQGWDPGPRHRFYRSLYERLLPLPSGEKRDVLDALRHVAGRGDGGRETHRALDERELTELARSGLFEIGAHSATHPALGALTRAAQEDEVRGSRARLEEIVGRPVMSFAYPHGSYTTETVEVVGQAGFARACSSDPLAVESTSDVLRLPRIVPRDWDGDRFRRWLSYWTG